jgi:methylmalonyl-CoA/ethylmalonyl-CoA epimerase
VALGRLHHVGYVVADIEAEIREFQASVNGSWDGVIFEDPLQRARVAFIQVGIAADPSIELVEPAGQNSPVLRFLTDKGGGLHHLCYEVADIEEQVRAARALKGFIVRRPVPAVAFGGRRIAWILTAQRLLLEFLEKGA